MISLRAALDPEITDLGSPPENGHLLQLHWLGGGEGAGMKMQG